MTPSRCSPEALGPGTNCVSGLLSITLNRGLERVVTADDDLVVHRYPASFGEFLRCPVDSVSRSVTDGTVAD
jgi:hypothetical protein